MPPDFYNSTDTLTSTLYDSNPLFSVLDPAALVAETECKQDEPMVSGDIFLSPVPENTAPVSSLPTSAVAAPVDSVLVVTNPGVPSGLTESTESVTATPTIYTYPSYLTPSWMTISPSPGNFSYFLPPETAPEPGSFAEAFTPEPAVTDIWQLMAEADGNNSGSLDNKDVGRASTAMGLIGAGSTSRAISDVALDTPELKKQYFFPFMTLQTGFQLSGRFNDIFSDHDQLASLEQLQGSMPSSQYESRKIYLEKDLSSAEAGATTDLLFYGQGVVSLVSDKAGASADQQFLGVGVDRWNQGGTALGMAGTLAQAYCLYKSVGSAWEKLSAEMAKPKEQRNDILMARALQNLSGAGSLLLTIVYRAGVAMFGDLSPAEIFSLLRGRGIPAKPDYMYNATFGKYISRFAVLATVSLALYDYVPKLQAAQAEGDDERYEYNLLGLSSVICRNVGLSLFNLNSKGAVRYAAGLIALGCAAGMYQVSFKENGGSDTSSYAYAFGANGAAPLLEKLDSLRNQNGLNSIVSDDQGWLDGLSVSMTGNHSSDYRFDGWREFLIVAGIDRDDHDSSVVDKNSFQVLARAGDVYSDYSGRDLTQKERQDLLFRLLTEANVSDKYQIPKKEMTTAEIVAYAYAHQYDAEGIGMSRNELDCSGPFLSRDSSSQAAYLVLLEASGLFSEDVLGTEIWNGPGSRLLRDRLERPDAQRLKKLILGYDARRTPLALVYLESQGIKTTPELEEAIKNLPKELELAGVGHQMAKMQSEMERYFIYASDDEGQPDQVSLDRLLGKIQGDTQFAELETPGGYEKIIKTLQDGSGGLDPLSPG